MSACEVRSTSISHIVRLSRVSRAEPSRLFVESPSASRPFPPPSVSTLEPQTAAPRAVAALSAAAAFVFVFISAARCVALLSLRAFLSAKAKRVSRLPKGSISCAPSRSSIAQREAAAWLRALSLLLSRSAGAGATHSRFSESIRATRDPLAIELFEPCDVLFAGTATETEAPHREPPPARVFASSLHYYFLLFAARSLLTSSIVRLFVKRAIIR